MPFPHARLRKLGAWDNIDSFFHAFPGFLHPPRRNHTPRNASPSCVKTAPPLPSPRSTIYPSGKSPERILSRRVAGDFLTDEAILATPRPPLASAPSTPTKGGPWKKGVWVGDGYKIDGERHLIFKHRHLTTRGFGQPDRGAALASTPGGGEATWAADIHSPPPGAPPNARNANAPPLRLALHRRRNGLSSCFSLLFQTPDLTWGFDFWNGRQARRIVAEQPAVLRVNDTWALAARLTQSTEQDIAPFRMLELVNNVRPGLRLFTRTRGHRAQTKCAIEGPPSPTPSPPVNAYAESLPPPPPPPPSKPWKTSSKPAMAKHRFDHHRPLPRRPPPGSTLARRHPRPHPRPMTFRRSTRASSLHDATEPAE